MRSESAGEDLDSDIDLDDALALVSEAGQIARALAAVISLIEEDAEASGLVDVVMFENQSDTPSAIAVMSLDREYVDTKLLRRLGQGSFGVVGKVIRTPEAETAVNAFRNSMFGTTNQLPVLLSRLTERLSELPHLLGDGVTVLDENGDGVFFSFVGSASAFTELQPLWVLPSLEVLPVAIYA